jgi:hypothetical protein
MIVSSDGDSMALIAAVAHPGFDGVTLDTHAICEDLGSPVGPEASESDRSREPILMFHEFDDDLAWLDQMNVGFFVHPGLRV